MVGKETVILKVYDDQAFWWLTISKWDFEKVCEYDLTIYDCGENCTIDLTLKVVSELIPILQNIKNELGK